MNLPIRDDKRTEELKLRLTEREMLDLKRLACEDGRTASDLCRIALRQFMYGLVAKLDGQPSVGDELVTSLIDKIARRRIPKRRRCIDDCAKARDDRGRWRQQRKCAQQLQDLGASPSIAAATAAAARNVGAHLAKRFAA